MGVERTGGQTEWPCWGVGSERPETTGTRIPRTGKSRQDRVSPDASARSGWYGWGRDGRYGASERYAPRHSGYREQRAGCAARCRALIQRARTIGRCGPSL